MRKLGILAPLTLLVVLAALPGRASAVSPSSSGAPLSTDAVFGVKGGVSISRLTGDAQGTEVRRGLVAGVQMDVPRTPAFAVRGELLYHEMGARHVMVGTAYFEWEPPAVPIYQHSRRNYLEFALLAKVRPTGSDVYWLAGPTLGVLLSHSETFAVDYDQDSYSNPVSGYGWYAPNLILEDPVPTSGSLLLGVGAEVKLGATTLLVEARYQWGLQDLARAAEFLLHDRCLTVLTGVRF